MTYKKVDVQQALDLRLNHNLSYARIAKIQGVCLRQSINESSTYCRMKLLRFIRINALIY